MWSYLEITLLLRFIRFKFIISAQLTVDLKKVFFYLQILNFCMWSYFEITLLLRFIRFKFSMSRAPYLAYICPYKAERLDRGGNT